MCIDVGFMSQHEIAMLHDIDDILRIGLSYANRHKAYALLA